MNQHGLTWVLSITVFMVLFQSGEKSPDVSLVTVALLERLWNTKMEHFSGKLVIFCWWFLTLNTQPNTVVDKMNSFSQQHTKDCNCHFIWFGSGHFEHTSKSLLHSKDCSRTVFLVCTVLAGGPKQARFLEAPDNCLTQPQLYFLPTAATASSRSFFWGEVRFIPKEL